MTNTTIGHADALRAEFDRAFAEAPTGAHAEQVDLLAVRLGGDPFAIRLSDTSGLYSDRRLTPVPSAHREFRGMAGVRGALVPVYDLAAAMGYPPGNTLRWLVIAREALVGFAFDQFDGQLRIDRTAVLAHESTSREHVHEVARSADVSYPIVHLPSLIAVIGKRTSDTQSRREA
ncbi:MAG TPA: chemotaxis protein CheW [Bauldia sp.]|nr:chemotaxis protein CheW [Bauldia sp.]